MLSTIEDAVHPAGSVEERRAPAGTVCAFYSGSNKSHFSQVATALMPAVIFRGALIYILI